VEEPVPQRLGRYQVLKHLATGGMAQVLLAYTQTPGGPAYHVVKRVRPDQARDQHFVQMFLDEARLAALLRHPSIVQVFEIADRGEFYFSMEYVHGEDLRRVLMEVHRAHDKVPIALITGVVAAAAEGLHYAHQLVGHDRQPLGIVHRDVSPANILVGYDGSVKLADFGIAKAALRTVETRSGTLKGKVSYMSPEQVLGRPIDHRSDVFALGIVLYEIATARRLFKGENDFLTMSAIVHGEIPPPSEHRPDLPRALEEIIMTALATEPADRYQSADELRGELESFMQSLGMRMSPRSIADYMKKLFGTRAEPWLVPDTPTVTTTVDFDGASTGVARVQSEAMPSLKASASSPLVYARSASTGRPATVPAEGWLEATPFGWSPEPPRRPSRKRLGIAIGAAAVASIAAVALIGRSGSTGAATASAPPVASQPVEPVTPPQDQVIPPRPEPVVAEPPPPTPPAPPPVREEAAPPPDPPTRSADPPRPRPVRRIVKRPRPGPTAPNKTWDPDTLFPK